MPMTDSRIPVILDTDIGSDIDDAVCLGYLLRQPRCELLGITTVSGQPRVRAAVADPETARKLREGYLEPMTGTAQFVRESIEADSASWGAFIRRRNLRVE